MADAVFVVVGRDRVTEWVRGRIWASKGELSSEGLAFPPGGPARQRAAVADLVGEGADGPSTWAQLARRTAARPETCVLVAADALVDAGPDALATVVSSLAPALVHVVHPVAPPALGIAMAWQEGLFAGGTVSFADFARDAPIVDPGDALAPWLDLLPAEQVHLVVGATPETLARRTAELLGVAPDVLGGPVDLLLPAADAEVLRRFNQRIDERTGGNYDDPSLREAVVGRRFVRPAFVPGPVGTLPEVPGAAEWFERVRALAPRLDVVGDLPELVTSPNVAEPDDADLLASGLRLWVRQLDAVEQRQERARLARRSRSADRRSDG